MKKYILAFLFIISSPSLLLGLPQEAWEKYENNEVAAIQLPESWEVKNGEAERHAFMPRSQPNLSDILGMIYSIKENLSAYDSAVDLGLEYVSLWGSGVRLKHVSSEVCEHITQLLNEERFLKIKPSKEEYLCDIRLIEKEYLKLGKFNFPVFTYELRTNKDFFKIRYVIALHQDKNRQGKILALRFLYSSPDTSEEDDASAVALANAITSKWEITPPGPYIEVPVVAVTIMSAYLLVWSGLLIKRLGRKNGRSASTSSYPHWLWHLKTFKGRLAYCPIFLLPFLWDVGKYLFPSEFLIVSAVAFITGIIVLSILHLVVREWKPWKERGKPFRVTVFMMGLWVIALFAFALVVGPERFDPEKTEESSVIVANILLWALLPAAMGGAVSYIYQKYIK